MTASDYWGRFAILFAAIGFALIIHADPFTGANVTILGYVALAVAMACGCVWAVLSGFFDDGDETGRTK